jgi:hypothetical protein
VEPGIFQKPTNKTTAQKRNLYESANLAARHVWAGNLVHGVVFPVLESLREDLKERHAYLSDGWRGGVSICLPLCSHDSTGKILKT